MDESSASVQKSVDPEFDYHDGATDIKAALKNATDVILDYEDGLELFCRVSMLLAGKLLELVKPTDQAFAIKFKSLLRQIKAVAEQGTLATLDLTEALGVFKQLSQKVNPHEQTMSSLQLIAVKNPTMVNVSQSAQTEMSLRSSVTQTQTETSGVGVQTEQLVRSSIA